MVRSAGCMCVRGSMLDHATLADAWANGLAGQWLFQQARPWCHHVSPVLPASQRCSTRSMSQLLEVPQARSRVAFNFLLSKVLYTQTTRPNHPPRGHLPVLWLPRARAGALQRREEGAALGACRAVQSDQVEPGALLEERRSRVLDVVHVQRHETHVLLADLWGGKQRQRRQRPSCTASALFTRLSYAPSALPTPHPPFLPTPQPARPPLSPPALPSPSHPPCSRGCRCCAGRRRRRRRTRA